MTITVYRTRELESINQHTVLSDIERQVEEVLSLTDFDYYRQAYGLRRGEKIIVREIEVMACVVQEPCYRWGFSGQLREVRKWEKRRVLSEQRVKLWHTKARGWYWKEVS